MAGLAVSLVSPAWDGLRKGRVLAQPSPRVSPPLLELALARLSALTLDVPQWDGVGRGGDGEYTSGGVGVRLGLHRGKKLGVVFMQGGGVRTGGMDWGQYKRAHVTGGEPLPLPTHPTEPPLSPFVSLA